MMNKINKIGKVFVDGVKVQLKQEWVWSLATVVGLYQGLKYKGNLKNGLLGGLATLITIGTANGIYNVVTNFDYIKQP